MNKIIIIGAGPTGLGAGYRLKELGYDNYLIYEKSDHIGGLSSSFKKQGFTFDIGGHVIFSHYKYFDKLVDKLLGDNYSENERHASVWIEDRFVDYPFQNNIHQLSSKTLIQCLDGLLEIYGEKGERQRAESINFKEWIFATFGHGVAQHFMLPYNYKVWAHDANLMSKSWLADRVSVIDLKRILRNLILSKKDVNWGPNNTFKYPLYDGTGGLFNAFYKEIGDKIKLNKEVIKIDSDKKQIFFSDNTFDTYDLLINTMPLDKLTLIIIPEQKLLQQASQDLLHNGVYVVGIGVKKKVKTKRCWVYFPENSSPFYRVTYLSNYSPNMTPKKDYINYLCETSYSFFKKEDKSQIIEKTIQGLINSKFLDEQDRANIITTVFYDAEYAYPIPSLDRDKALNVIIPKLEDKNIYSRGRFGQWRYEAGNMDHSVMQGVEVVNYLLNNEPEKARYFV